jgi:hypothetical protein
VGSIASIAGYLTSRFDSLQAFVAYWMIVSLIAMAGAFLLVRRQAIREREVLLSPPTRRIFQALFPALFVGMFIGIASAAALREAGPIGSILLASFWAALYGCALSSAGFFMPRGIKLFAWFFILGGCAFPICLTTGAWWVDGVPPHLLMGAYFGLSHLAYGIYLYFTESRKNET